MTREEQRLEEVKEWLRKRNFDAPEITVGWLEVEKPKVLKLTLGHVRVLVQTIEEAKRYEEELSAETAKHAAEALTLRARVVQLERGTNLVTTDTEKRLLADLAARDARVERLREALGRARDALVKLEPVVELAPMHHRRVEAYAAQEALSEPIAPWLRERDRALAMRVAELAYMRGYSDGHPDECFPTNKPIAAIVDAALKVKP